MQEVDSQDKVLTLNEVDRLSDHNAQIYIFNIWIYIKLNENYN